MSRWYDQHRLERRVRKLERHADVHHKRIDLVEADVIECNPGGSVAAEERRGLSDAISTRDHATDIRSDAP